MLMHLFRIKFSVFFLEKKENNDKLITLRFLGGDTAIGILESEHSYYLSEQQCTLKQ